MLSEMTNFLISIQTKSQKGGAFCQKHEVRLKALDKKKEEDKKSAKNRQINYWKINFKSIVVP